MLWLFFWSLRRERKTLSLTDCLRAVLAATARNASIFSLYTRKASATRRASELQERYTERAIIWKPFD